MGFEQVRPASSAGSVRRPGRPTLLRSLTGLAVSALVFSAVVISVGISPSTVRAADPLISQGKPATASSTENATYPASAAVDGSTTTRWSSAFSDPQWLEVDLGSTATISQVSLNWEAAYARSFQIQVSTDNSNWTSIYSTTTGAGGVQTLAVSGTGRYVRMYGTVRGTVYGYSLWEFQVYGSFGGAIDARSTIQAESYSSQSGTQTETTTDTGGGSDVGYIANGDWIAFNNVDFGTTAVNSFSARIASGAAAGVTGNIVVHVDSLTGTTIATMPISPTGGWQTWQTLNAATGATTGIHTTYLVFTSGQGADFLNVNWFTFSGGSVPTPTATPTATASPTSGTCGGSNTPNFGPNVSIFDTSMSASSIQSTLDSVFNGSGSEMGTERHALFFKPGTYSVTARVGYYMSVAGLGQNPDQVVINGGVNADASGSVLTQFWRSAENMQVNPTGGLDRWATSQAAPFRRMDIRGNLDLWPSDNGYSSGGYIADSNVTGTVTSGTQQQYYSRDSNYGSWSGSNWNMVFSGVTGAPGQSFPNPPFTTLATTPVSRDVPYLYIDSSGNYNVFLPSLRTNASGRSWASGSTPGTSLPMSSFYVVGSSDTAATINSALSRGCNVFFTPGVYHINQTLNVSRADTIILGVGLATLIPDNGVNTMQVANVDGVRIKGLIFDAGTTNSAALLTLGTAGNTTSHASDPASIQDVFFRIGGDIAGKATASLVVNSYDTIIDHIWAWRADHGNGGTVGWTVNTADNALVVNGNNVIATGLFTEHYQKYEVTWNGQNGKIVFFQNEMPYDVPNQASWMNGSINGYAAIKVGTNVTTFEAWGLGSYCYFNVNNSVSSYHAFESPTLSTVKWHDLLTISLNAGTITHVINDTGATTPSGVVPVKVVSYP
jgi:Carbohydrate binding module (family 6)/F5/8 type C domain